MSLNIPPADLTGTIFNGADLRGVDLSCVDGITADQLQDAIIDETTLMPPGLEHLVREVPIVPLPIQRRIN